MKQKKIALSVFLVSFVLGLNVAGVAPILGVLKVKYAEYGTTLVQLLQSSVYLLIIAGALALGWFTTKFSKKKIATMAAIWVGVFGLIPMFIEGYEVLLACRILIGFGFGILNPLNVAIIAELFEPKDRAGYMGMHVVGMGAGAIAGNMLGGILAGVGYRYFYLIFLIAFICAIGIQCTLPQMEVVPKEKAKNAKLNGKVYALLVASFFQLLFIDAFNINIGIYLSENVSGSTAMAGTVTTVNAVLALITGLLFAKIIGKFGIKAIAIAVIIAALGYLAIIVIPGMPGVYISSAFGGICRSCYGAGSGLMIANFVSKEAAPKASGINSVMSSIGGLVAPSILGTTSTVVLGANTPINQFWVAFVGMLLLGIALFLAFTGAFKKKV